MNDVSFTAPFRHSSSDATYKQVQSTSEGGLFHYIRPNEGCWLRTISSDIEFTPTQSKLSLSNFILSILPWKSHIIGEEFLILSL